MKIKGLLTASVLLLPLVSFGLSLDEAVKDVVKTSPDIQERVKYFRAVKQDIGIAKSGYYPTLDLVAGYGKEMTNDRSTNYDDVTMTRKEAAIILNQNLFNGMGTTNDVKRQYSRLDSAAYSAIEKADSVGLRTTEVYLELIKQKELLALAAENLQAHKDINSQIKERIDSGIGTKSELEQSDSRLALAESNLIVQQNNFEDAMTNFRRVYGADFDPETFSAPVADFQLEKSLDDALKISDVRNPSLNVQRANVNVAKYNYKIAEKDFYPKVDFEVRHDRNTNINAVEGGDTNTTYMLKASFNIFNGGADKSERQKRISELNQETQSLQDLKRRVDESLRLSWMAYTTLDRQMSYLERHRDLSKNTLESYDEEFKLGRRTLLDILDTKEEYYGANRELLTAKYDLIFAKYRVLNSMGVLLDTMGVEFKDMVGLGSAENSKADEKDNVPE